MSEHITRLPISKFIDIKFREYAIYVLEQRGIPSFYDALTPVQRYILMNAPSSFQKTLSLVGNCIADHYTHGDSSLMKSISKLTRPFGLGLQILEGYGFFGTEICPEPAAARYTSVRISSKTNDILKKYKHLFEKDEEGPYHPFWIDIPLGLTTPIIGIAVGYKTIILPRKLEDIQKYLEGKIKSLKPYFIDFAGTIEKYKGLKNIWLISSKFNIIGNKIEIRGIPPILKYTSTIKRLDFLFEKFNEQIRIINNSNTKVNIDVIYIGKKKEEWIEIQQFCKKVFSIIVTENPIFIKDNQVLIYDTVEQYLDNYQWQLKRLAYNKSLYERNFLLKELEFNKVKEQFINFILLKKRSVNEIDEFIKLYESNIKDRLERLTSKKFTKDELIETSQKIKELIIELKEKEKELKQSKSNFNKIEDPTLKIGISSKKINSNLFDTSDIDEIDGICIWNGEDVIDNNQKEVKNDELDVDK